MTSTIEEIRIENCGPISHASLPYLPGGGLVVLRGRQGVGKSITLDALQAAATGKGRVPIKDGELRGSVEAFGVTMTIGKSTRRSGEPEVVSLEGRLSAADLVDPGIASPDAADARRIKALIQLANVKPSPELFYPLVGEREHFEQLVSAASLASDDLVVMAERVKRDLESKARSEESQAEHAEGRARGAREAANGVDLKAAADSDALQAELEAAIREESRLKSQADAATKAAMAARLASDQLADAEDEYCGLPLAECQEAESKAKCDLDTAERAVREAEEALRKARAEHETARNEYSHAIAARKTAEQHEAMVKQWREQLAASIPASPTAEQLADAAGRVAKARQAVEQGALVRKARQHIAEAEAHGQAAAKHRKQAQQLRDAAKGTDDVLSQVVAKTGSPLRVEHGRLVLDTPRGKTLFAELSDGERWKLALDIAIDAVGSHGFITIPQWAWGELQPANRRAIAAQLRDRGVVAYTAEATDDDELNAEVYGVN